MTDITKASKALFLIRLLGIVIMICNVYASHSLLLASIGFAMMMVPSRLLSGLLAYVIVIVGATVVSAASNEASQTQEGVYWMFIGILTVVGGLYEVFKNRSNALRG